MTANRFRIGYLISYLKNRMNRNSEKNITLTRRKVSTIAICTTVDCSEYVNRIPPNKKVKDAMISHCSSELKNASLYGFTLCCTKKKHSRMPLQYRALYRLFSMKVLTNKSTNFLNVLEISQ